ncbi:outer membrane beta-barrel protein [Chryseobacterium indoltheticum]|uniref:outer membrane beta-barrel protein n=1 Tax=Chryseobacterium indoltheticum TaxID=254 RepID=UPI0019136914|nr:outer membrane beta-barrel protein [Chryseobacterium indoltheticum]QQQ30009.1 outer membrane beta-barrel protein [Chryseobacterium indoltheticum]
MLLRKIILLFSVIFITSTFAQRKKTDTIYVYEKVIVYDTIYLEKAIKLKPVKLMLSSLEIQAKEIKSIPQNTNKEEIEEQLNKISVNKFQYGIEAGIGLKKVSWAENLSEKNQQFGQNFGIWISKNIINPNFSLMLSATIYHWNSTFDLDANKEETYLDGFYFSKDNQPLLFQRFNNKHFEYILQLKAIYEWKNLRPFVGFLANKNNYKMQFLVPENNVLNKLDDFKSNQVNFGFSLGLQYLLFNRFLIDVEYQHFKIKNLSLKNSSFDFDIFKTNNTFAERKISLGISYFISK